MFNEYEEKALNNFKNINYESENSKKRIKTVHHDKTRDGKEKTSAKDNFRINTFYVIIDRLATTLSN